MTREEIIGELKKRGCRITGQRLLILDTILTEKSFCCKEVYYKVAKQDDRIGCSTVYRMVNLLEEMGALSGGNIYNVVDGIGEEKSGIYYHEIIECIACALDAKDAYTAGHSERVSDMALKVCELIGFKKTDAEKIHIAAHLHDIGKIGVPDAVLNKEGKLNETEWLAIRKHPEIGAEILSKSKHLSELKEIVLSHHERYDGKGYPRGLKGEEIPVGARIIAICDSIDAMTSNRSYRKAHNFEFCRQELEKNLGKMYDPVIGKYVLDHFEEIVDILKR